VAVKARQLDRRFVGFATRVAEEDLVHAGQRRQLVGQLLLLRNAVEVRRVQQAPGLRRDRRDQRRVVVPQRRHGNSRQGVEIALAVGIGQPTAIAMAEGDRQASVGIHQVRHGPPIAEALKLKRRLAPPDNETRTRTSPLAVASWLRIKQRPVTPW
jgi:hypothetical protein